MGPRWSSLAVVMAAFVAFLLVVATFAGVGQLRPPPSAGLQASSRSLGTLTVSVRVHAGLSPLDAHVAAVPQSARIGDSTAFYFFDPAYPLLYATTDDVVGGGARISGYLAQMNDSIHLQSVSGADLQHVLAGNPSATVVMLGGGILPDAVFSNSSQELPEWLQAGGVLVWAGGPLAYFEGHPLSDGGFDYQDLMWSGQTRLLGWSMTDQGPDPASKPATPVQPTFGTNQSAIGQALGITYLGAYFGANTTALAAHGGVALGSLSSTFQGHASRTSLAWIPVGAGGIFYFGGAMHVPGEGSIPYASVDLDQDIALLLALGYRPAGASPVGADIEVPSGGTQVAQLSVVGAGPQVEVFVRSSLLGALIFYWQGAVPAADTLPGSRAVPGGEAWSKRPRTTRRSGPA